MITAIRVPARWPGATGLCAAICLAAARRFPAQALARTTIGLALADRISEQAGEPACAAALLPVRPARGACQLLDAVANGLDIGVVSRRQAMRVVGRPAGRLMQEAEDFDVQPPGDLGGGGIAVGHRRASDGVVGYLGFAAWQFLNENGDRRVGAGGGSSALIGARSF
jgi:hypothetical protein